MQEENNKVFQPDLSLKELINLKDWQKIQDNFSAITGIRLRTLDSEGKSLTSPSGENKFCAKLLKESHLKEKICGPCLPKFLGGSGMVDKNLNFVCYAGFHNFVVPLRLNKNKVLGYVIAGPVILVMRKDKEGYREIAEELNIDLEKLWDAILDIRVISFHGIKSIIELIKDVCEYTLNLAYRYRIKAKELIPFDSAQLNEILNTLLDVACEVSQADIGSVMVFDENKQNLTIKASKGIPEEIIAKTKVRLGDGISGIAAKEGASFLIDENIKDRRIRPHLNRPYISSSMVLPIKVKNRVMGVMNLASLKTSPTRFSSGNLQVMNRLVGLATVALSPKN